MTAPTAAPPVAPAVAPSTAPAAPPATPAVSAPVPTQEKAKDVWNDRIARIVKSNNGKPNDSPADKAAKGEPRSAANGPAPSPLPDAIAASQTTAKTGELPRADGGTPPAATPEGTSTPVTELPALVTELRAESPEGDVVLRSRTPDGQFAEMDRTRKFELAIRDKQTGETKVYEKDLDGLMRLAKDGIATQRAQDEVKRSQGELKHYRENLPKWQQEYAQAQQQAKDLPGYIALAQRLLTAPEHEVVELRAQYAAENSPEKIGARELERVQAARAELARQQAQFQQVQQLANVRSAIGPTISRVQQVVGEDAATGNLMRAMAPLMVNGVLPPAKIPDLVAYVNGPYLQWAEAIAQQRAAQATAAAAPSGQQHGNGNGAPATNGASSETARLQRENQRLANVAGAALRPAGHSGPDVAPKTPAKNAADMVERIIRGRPAPQLGT